jgi:hypothetical protein
MASGLGLAIGGREIDDLGEGFDRFGSLSNEFGENAKFVGNWLCLGLCFERFEPDCRTFEDDSNLKDQPAGLSTQCCVFAPKSVIVSVSHMIPSSCDGQWLGPRRCSNTGLGRLTQ